MRKPLTCSTRLFTRLGLCLALATAGATANASVIWQLNSFSFSDGGTASGSFTWDEAANRATSWDIVTTAGSTLGGNTYTEANSSTYSSSSVDDVAFYVGSLQLRIGVADLNLLDTPSTHLDLFAQNVGQVGSNGYLECVNCSPARLGKAGAYLSADAPASVPEPSTAALSFLAMGLMAVVRRKAR